MTTGYAVYPSASNANPIGTITNTIYSFMTDSIIAGGFDIPGVTTNQALYLGGSVPTVKSEILSLAGVNTLGLGIYTVDPNQVQPNGQFGDASLNCIMDINCTTTQNGAQYRYAINSILYLNPATITTYNGNYIGTSCVVENANANLTGVMIGGSFFCQTFVAAFTKYIAGGEFACRSYGIGETPSAFGGIFDGATASGTGSNPHVAAGIYVGNSSAPFSSAISSSGSSVSNTAIGIWVNSGSITASGTGAAQYALKIDDPSQSTFAGSIATATRLLSGGAGAATNTALVTKDGNWKSTQTTAPTTTINANAGTGATAVVTHGTDVAGILTLTTTATLPSLGAQCTVNFNKTYNVAPIVMLTSASANAASLAVSTGIYVTSTTSAFTINFASADVVGHAYVFYYFCLETQ